MIRAVIFDVGGPLDMETAFEAAIDADLREGLAREGFPVDDGAWHAAHKHAVDAFAPSLYRALLWRLTAGDVAACRRIYDWTEQRAHARDLFELRPGIAEVLAALSQHGIGHLFQNQGLSGIYGLRKPDVRLFLRACEDLGVEPHECIMVGDRIDNDVAPANLLGMRTVLLRTGRHVDQQPRSWDETPDVEVHDAAGILQGIDAIVAAAKAIG